MTTKNYLEQALHLDAGINAHLEELNQLKELKANLMDANGGQPEGNGNAGSPSTLVKTLERIHGMEEAINREIDELVDRKAEIRTRIGQLTNPEEQTVLRCRYLFGLTWEETGNEMNASVATVCRWHRKALEHMVL